MGEARARATVYRPALPISGALCLAPPVYYGCSRGPGRGARACGPSTGGPSAPPRGLGGLGSIDPNTPPAGRRRGETLRAASASGTPAQPCILQSSGGVNVRGGRCEQRIPGGVGGYGEWGMSAVSAVKPAGRLVWPVKAAKRRGGFVVLNTLCSIKVIRLSAKIKTP